MANHKRSAKRPQPKHKNHKKSQYDKRSRLQRPNPKRRKTTAAQVPLTGAMRTAVSALQAILDRRIAFRLAIIVAGMFLADDRRTASVAVHALKLALHDFGKLIMKEVWTLSNSRTMSVRDASRWIG